MKVTMQQISEGVARYIDSELVPKVPGIRKWMLGVAGAFAGKIVENAMRDYSSLLSGAGIIGEDGMVDLDKFMPSFKSQANKSGPVTEHLPMLGDITFDSSDVDKLYSYIAG